MKKLFTTIIIFAFVSNISFSQNESKKFGFSLSAPILDFYSPDEGGLYSDNTVSTYPGHVDMGFAYNLIKPINLATSLSIGGIEKINRPLSDFSYWKWDVGAQFRFLSPFMDDEHWFDPYVYANGGVFHMDNTTSPELNGGLGLNLWIADHFAFSVESGYNYGFNLDSYLETIFGIKIRLGSGEKDSDGDGIVDSKDKCPNVPGKRAYDGCPDMNDDKKKEIEDNIRLSAKNIEFDTGKSTIRSTSYKDIDNIVLIMKKIPIVKFDIEGHTDNTGNYDSNKALSQKRADAVKKYITDKGISASRLYAKGYGSDKPIAGNDTEEGRQQNRRVEFTVVK